MVKRCPHVSLQCTNVWEDHVRICLATMATCCILTSEARTQNKIAYTGSSLNKLMNTNTLNKLTAKKELRYYKNVKKISGTHFRYTRQTG